MLSDHGDFAGDYSIAEKAQNCFEDCLTHVPFLIKPPGDVDLDAGVSDSIVELVDFYATAMDFAQATPSHEHYGKSLRPILANRTVELRQYAFCEGGRNPGETQCDEYHGEAGESRPTDVYWPKKMAQLDDEAHAKATMIRSKRYKYISRTLGGDELYDLYADPGERVNRIDDPALDPVRRELQTAMLKWLQTTSDVVPLDYDRRLTEEMLWNKVRGLVPPAHEDEVRQKIRNGIGIGALFGYYASLAQEKGEKSGEE